MRPRLATPLLIALLAIGAPASGGAAAVRGSGPTWRDGGRAAPAWLVAEREGRVAAAPDTAAYPGGPKRGWLVIVGGNLHDPAIVRRFIELAGGPDAPLVMIPTASAGDHFDLSYPGLEKFRDAGATNMTLLHTRDRAVANTDSFVAPLRHARGVWFFGGRQWRLADAYLGTRTEAAIDSVLARGGVVGGSSAGATIQGSFLVRGDTKTNTIMMGDHQKGFGLLPGVAIDQHVLVRNREFDLIPVIERHPKLLGIGLDENTAIVVHGDRFQVIGQSYVAIYDPTHRLDSGGRFYFLRAGDRYDLTTRTAYRPVQVERPLGRVEAEDWGSDSTGGG